MGLRILSCSLCVVGIFPDCAAMLPAPHSPQRSSIASKPVKISTEFVHRLLIASQNRSFRQVSSDKKSFFNRLNIASQELKKDYEINETLYFRLFRSFRLFRNLSSFNIF